MKYVFVQGHRGAFSAGLMCRTLGMGSSGFHTWLKRPDPVYQPILKLLRKRPIQSLNFLRKSDFFREGSPISRR